jgi:hypothetical protein
VRKRERMMLSIMVGIAAIRLNILRCSKSLRPASFSTLRHLNPPSSLEGDGRMESRHRLCGIKFDRSTAVASHAS